MISIITAIDIDHQEFLGNTVKKITNEKLGIIREYENVIIAKQNIFFLRGPFQILFLLLRKRQ